MLYIVVMLQVLWIVSWFKNTIIAVQSQNNGSCYLKSKQLLLFAFAITAMRQKMGLTLQSIHVHQ